jgi:hypothetical protein
MSGDFLCMQLWMKLPTGAAQLTHAVDRCGSGAASTGIVGAAAVVSVIHRLNIHY